jgi:hypothetical protein
MTYRLHETGAIFQVEANLLIPPDPANTDYAAYLQWLTEGNTPEPAPEPPAPVELTPAEKLAAAGLTVDDLRALLAEG